jgi:hypothetical protein
MMTDTALGHPLVRGYLVTLDESLRRLPAVQARELREQITTHLNEALPPGAGDSEVRAVLGQLGRPADLVAEAVAATGAVSPAAALAGLGAAVRLRLAQVRGRTWLIAAAVVAVAMAGAVRSAHFLGAGPLEPGIGITTWWYPQDQKNSVDSEANLTVQSTTLSRTGQRQGFVVGLYNPTDVTQTITGIVAYSNPGGALTQQVAVSASESPRNGPVQTMKFTLPGVIPPHQWRQVRLLWVTRVCLDHDSYLGMDHLKLHVRVGWFTRTEDVPIGRGFYLTGAAGARCH